MRLLAWPKNPLVPSRAPWQQRAASRRSTAPCRHRCRSTSHRRGGRRFWTPTARLQFSSTGAGATCSLVLPWRERYRTAATASPCSRTTSSLASARMPVWRQLPLLRACDPSSRRLGASLPRTGTTSRASRPLQSRGRWRARPTMERPSAPRRPGLRPILALCRIRLKRWSSTSPRWSSSRCSRSCRPCATSRTTARPPSLSTSPLSAAPSTRPSARRGHPSSPRA
mmetsp:Transcript_89946/g.254790  ORF Transcript_89946/g.254790 Transcript_89946/m.254790 type:complete len:226 (+) Transcript_89946:325-1002(+)